MASRSSFTHEKRRSRDSQERHAFDEYKSNEDEDSSGGGDSGGGSGSSSGDSGSGSSGGEKEKKSKRPTLKVTGNGTEEEFQVEIPIGMFTYPKKKTDIEVLANGHGDDPHNKRGRMTQPEDTRYKPKEGEHGLQDPVDKAELMMFTKDGQRLAGKKGHVNTNEKDIEHKSTKGHVKATADKGDFRATATEGVSGLKGKKASSIQSGGSSVEVKNGIVYLRGQVISEQPITIGSCPSPE